MPVITDNNTLKDWLSDSPPEFACVIASRAALRVAPLLVEALRDDSMERRASIILSGFRTLLTVHIASSFITNVPDFRNIAGAVSKEARDNVSEVANSAQMGVIEATEAVPEQHFYIQDLQSDVQGLRTAEDAVYAAVHAVQVAIDTVDATNGIASPIAAYEATTETINTALTAVDGAHGYTELHRTLDADTDNEIERGTHIIEFWKAVELDAELLEAGKGAIGNLSEFVSSISGRALWLGGLPVWVGRRWAGLKEKLPAIEGWQVWIDWYEARLTGESSDERKAVDLVMIPKEDWDQGPTHVNDIIAKCVETEPDPMIAAIAHSVMDFDAVKEVMDLGEYSTRIQNALPDDPKLAIGTTKEMLEAMMRTILHRRGTEMEELKKLDFPPLTGRCFSELGLSGNLAPTTVSETYHRKIASSARKMVNTINDFRNHAGTGHGHVIGAEPRVTEADAYLVASTGFVLAAWLARHHREHTLANATASPIPGK